MTKWLRTVDIKQFLTHEDVADDEAQIIGRRIGQYLRTHIPDCPVILDFMDADNQEAVNKALDLLYDWGDQEGVWLGL